MSNQLTETVSSPVQDDPFQGQEVSMSEFSRYREDGELPERFKTAEDADPAPADAQEETEESEESDEAASESATDEVQEKPQKGGAEKRIKQLLAKQKELEVQLAQKGVTPVPPTVQPTQYTRPKPTADDKVSDGTSKYSTYEDFVEELADWKAEQRMVAAQREYQQNAAQTALQGKLDEARTRYSDADEVIFPAVKSISESAIPLIVKDVFDKSDVFVDLCYVVGSDPDELKSFISLAQTNPRAALAKVFEYERGIKEELSRASKDTATPEKKITSAPKPPSPVGGSSSRAFDVSDESLSADEWFRKRNQAIEKKRL